MSKDPLDNEGRADFAAAALQAYHSETRFAPDTYGNEDSEQFVETFGDLLGDLQHLARRAGANFAELLAAGTSHFEYEVEQEQELERRSTLAQLPVDEQVYAALGEEHATFKQIMAEVEIEKTRVRLSLLRLKEAGRAEMYPGRGWRRVTVPVDERVLAELTDEFTYTNDLEARILVASSDLSPSLHRLLAAGKAEVDYGKGWRRTPQPAAEAP